MRLGGWILIGLLLGLVGAHFLLPDNGYVLINFRGYLVEMSVPGLIIVLSLAYLVIRLLLIAWQWPRRVGALLAERRRRTASRKLTRGVMHLVGGEWSKGERLLTQSVRGSDTPLVSYLMAARAAQQQGHRERRDEWLQLAHEELPDAHVTVMLTQAELQLEARELERALATLRRLEELHPGHPMGLALLARTYRALGDHAAQLALLPRLGPAPLEPQELEACALEALSARVVTRADFTHAELEALWATLPGTLRRAPALIAQRALTLERLGHGAEAERELRTALRGVWAGGLVDAYGRVTGTDPVRQLKRAEGWLERYPEDGALLLTAARLCIRNELWGKARSYLESALAIDAQVETYALYGRLLAQLGEGERAAAAYRSGLGLVTATARTPALAAPRAEERAKG